LLFRLWIVDGYDGTQLLARYNAFRQQGVIHTYRQRVERLSFLSPTSRLWC
jgi:hypothetical protein